MFQYYSMRFLLLRTLPILFFLFICSFLVQPTPANAYFYIEVQEEQEGTKKEEAPNEAVNENENKQPPSSQTLQRSEIKIAAPTDAFTQKNNDLKHYFPQDSAQSLLAGTEEYLIIEETSFTQNNKGVAILLPDWQQGLTNPKAINFLRKALPKMGWSTISIQPPNMPNNYPILSSDKKAQHEENNKILTAYQEKLKTLMTAVMEKAKNYPGIFLVITQGGHSAMLTQLYKENNALLPSAMIMLSAGMYTPFDNKLFAKNLAMSELPTLDLVLQRDSKIVLENAILRKKLATKEMKIYYRQKQLHNFYTGYYPEQTLLTEINGWLKTIGW